MSTDAAQGPFLLDVRALDGPDKHPTIHRMFDAENYRAYQAEKRVWVAILPTLA